MRSAVIALALAFSPAALAATPGQTTSQKRAEVRTLKGLLADAGATRLRCALAGVRPARAFELTFAPGSDTGAAIAGALGYGDNAIGQISVGASLFLTYGEESNYTLIIDDLAGLVDGGEAAGKIIFNDEELLVKALGCTLHAR